MRSAWLAARSAEFRDDFLALGGVVELPKGAVLYRAGQLSPAAFGLIRGQIDVIAIAPNGTEIVWPSTTPSKWFGFGDLVVGAPRAATAIVREDSLAHRIGRLELIRFLDARPERYREL
ncbi:MAG: cyclic nucleotide-binding domain-containing protein, partial [Pseudomonadota bacterium]